MNDVSLLEIANQIENLTEKCRILEKKYFESNEQTRKILIKKIYAIKFFALPRLRLNLDKL